MSAFENVPHHDFLISVRVYIFSKGCILKVFWCLKMQIGTFGNPIECLAAFLGTKIDLEIGPRCLVVCFSVEFSYLGGVELECIVGSVLWQGFCVNILLLVLSLYRH